MTTSGRASNQRGNLTTEGTVPAHRPLTPSSWTMLRTTAAEVLCGFCLDCSLVLMRSIGFVAQAARDPLREPAAMLRTRELFSLVAPSRSFTGL